MLKNGTGRGDLAWMGRGSLSWCFGDRKWELVISPSCHLDKESKLREADGEW